MELGEQPKRPLDVLNGLLASLEPSRSAAITLDEALDRWRRVLGEHRYLLVIDDVWQAQALAPLLEGGLYCMRLVTTRNDQVLPEEAARFFVDAMEPEEAIALLCRGLPEEIEQEAYQPVVADLADRLGFWPLLLTLAHGLLLRQIHYGRTLAQALDVVEHAYQHRGVTAFHLERAYERHQTVERCLEVSLLYLEECTPTHYQAAMRYQELAIFPEDTDIPLATLHTFWQGTGGLEAWEVDELCVRLHQLSLLLTCNLGKGIVRLHDVMRSYLESRVGSNLPALHARFLDVSKLALGLSHWADLPVDESYLWQHLVLHLCLALQVEELQTTLTDLFYLAHKALYMGISALEADLLRACTSQQTDIVEFFELLYQNIVHLCHLLRETHTLAEIGGLLLSHLESQPLFAAQWHALVNELPRPFLMAWHPLPYKLSSALLRTLRGHAGYVRGCAVSPDGRFIVSASDDKILKVWDATTGAECLTLSGHTGPVTDCAVSPDGRFIVSTSRDRTLKIWDVATGAERLSLKSHTGVVLGCAVSPDGSFVVSISEDNTLKVWDALTGAERLSFNNHLDYVENFARVKGCVVSPDGCFIVSASDDKTLKVWDVVTGAERLPLSGHTGPVTGCAMSPDGRFIVSASEDKTLKVWDIATGAERLSFKGHTSGVLGCAVSPNGKWVVSASRDSTLKVWDTSTGVERLSLTSHTGPVTDCAVSPDGRFIVSSACDNTLKVWDATIDAEHLLSKGYLGYTDCCAVSPDGKWIVSASGRLRVWDATTGAERLSLTSHTSLISGCAVSPDGKWIVSASWDNTLKVWDASTGAECLTLIGHTDYVEGCAVSPDGKWIVSASRDNTLKVWDATTGVERLTLIGHVSDLSGCAVSPDGRFIVSASLDSTLKVWDAVTGVERFSLMGHLDSVEGCVVSPDGKWIVSASRDNTLKVWDAATGVERLALTGHIGYVNGCAVSPDGNYIVSVSLDDTLRVWDAQTGQCLLTFPVDGALLGCAFHPDGEHLVACGAQGMYFLQLVV